jgi:hypothetical protein
MGFDGVFFEIILKLSGAICGSRAGYSQNNLKKPTLYAVAKTTGQTGNVPDRFLPIGSVGTSTNAGIYPYVEYLNIE